MPSILSRLTSLVPGFSPRATPPPARPLELPPETPAERADRLLRRTRAAIDESRRRPAPGASERVPQHYGVGGKVFFLPYRDSATHDSPEIRAAMRLMRRDGYVKAAWEPQVLAVEAEDWQVQPAEEGNPEAEEQARAVSTMFADYLAGGVPALVRAVCAPFGSEGHSLGEKVWAHAGRGRLEGQIVLAALKAKDTDATTGVARLDGDGYGAVTHVTALRAEGQPQYPVSDFVFSRYLTVFDEPLGEAAFRPAYGPYWMRDTVRKLRAIHHEKKAAGMLVGEYESDDDKAPLEAALARAATSTWMSVPAGVRVQAVALSTAAEPDYKSFDEGLRDEIVTAIAFATLQILVGGAGPDARGNSEVQKSMADLGPWLLMALVCDAVNTQVIPDYIDFNYPYPAAGAYPKLTFGAVSNQELLELLQVVTGAQQAGLTPSKKYYAKALSIQQADPNDPDDAMTPAGAGGAPGGGLAGLLGGGGPAAGAGAGTPGADALPPGGGDPFAALPPDATGAALFSERATRGPWESFAAGAWKVGKNGGRYLLPEGKEDVAENRLYGRAGEEYERQHNSAAARAGRAARGVNRAVGRAQSHAAVATRGALWTAQALGRGLKRLGWLERTTGLGRAIEVEVRRRRARLEAVARAARAGGAVAGAREAGRRALEYRLAATRRIRRKYGVIPALLTEGLMLAVDRLKGVWRASSALATKGLSPLLGKVLEPAREFVAAVLGPALKKLLEVPFRVATRNVPGLMTTRRDYAKLRAYRQSEHAFADGGADSFLAAVREALDTQLAISDAGPLPLTDDQLAQLVGELVGHVEAMLPEGFAEGFAEGAGDWDAFAWTAARSRSGSVKAVGTGEHAGQVLYGRDAEAALAQQGGGGRGPGSEKPPPGDDPGRNFGAQAGIVAGAALGAMAGPLGSAAGAAAGGLVGWLMEHGGSTRERAAADARGLSRGDPAAARRVEEASRTALDAAAAAAPNVPAGDPAATRRAWDEAAAGADPKLAAALGGHLERLATERDPGAVRATLGGIVRGLAALPLAAARGLVHAIGQFAGAARRALGPFGWWAGGIAAACAVAAVPALAAGVGLVEWPYALAAAPLAVAGFFAAKRASGRAMTRSEAENWGAAYAERPTAAEVLDAMVHRFGWRPRYGEPHA